MKTSDGLSDTTASVTKSPAKCEKCGATTRLHSGVCVSCLLGEGLEAGDEVSRATFESVIAEVDVPDKHPRLASKRTESSAARLQWSRIANTKKRWIYPWHAGVPDRKASQSI
jgi:hypothetical protein